MEESVLPNSWLSQNYPNPFGAHGVGATTTIEYAIQTAGHVTLSVYNVLGHEVAILVDDFKPAGVHKVTFDGRDLPGGLYFCRLNVGAYAEVEVMILVR
ncbi:MAG TPA: T9SS type A sorting domain-containing protein [Rhodothermales bacterium]|nr:T9SS type A sorting domain-containing protein [Rhodothermales bacterium]